MGKKSRPLNMTAEQRSQLEAWVRAKTTPQRVVFRSRICLLAADATPAADIAAQMNTSRPTVLVWRRRFEKEGPEGLTKDAPRGPSPRRLDEFTRQAIVDATLNAAPPGGRTWTTRSLADAFGVSNATVARIWNDLGIGRASRGKAVRDSRIRAEQPKYFDVAAAYMNPPVKVLAITVGRLADLGVAPDPGLKHSPLRPPARRRPEEHEGCGSCLSAALCLLDSMVGSGHGGLDLQGCLRGLLGFLARIEGRTIGNSELHVFLEETAGEILAAVELWAGSNRRIHVHAIPVGSLGDKGVQDTLTRITGTMPTPFGLRGAPCLVAAIDEFVRTEGPEKPFLWVGPAPPVQHGPLLCKAILETMRALGTLVREAARFHKIKEEPMSWIQKLESWFAAAAFAEEGEHETALRIADAQIPAASAPVSVLPSLGRTFAAAAFAEENCHRYAEEIEFGIRRRNRFLETVGLQNARVRYGVVPLQQSFVEAVGLASARCRLLTVQM